MLLLTLPKGLCHSELFCKNSSEHEMLWNSKPRNSRRGYVIRVFNVLLAKTLLKLRHTRFLKNLEFKKVWEKWNIGGIFLKATTSA